MSFSQSEHRLHALSPKQKAHSLGIIFVPFKRTSFKNLAVIFKQVSLKLRINFKFFKTHAKMAVS